MAKFKSFIAKIKSVKNIEIYVAAVLGLVVVAVLVFGGVFSTKNSAKSTTLDSYISQRRLRREGLRLRKG